MRLFDFSEDSAVSAWRPMNDVVMGGVSTGRLRRASPRTAEFIGRVSFQNNGGFASVRSGGAPLDLSGYSGLELRIRGDGRIYKVNIKTESSFDGVLYRAYLPTDAQRWLSPRLDFETFEPTFRGRIVTQAVPADLTRVHSLGLMISNRQEGPFRLELEWIAAYAER